MENLSECYKYNLGGFFYLFLLAYFGVIDLYTYQAVIVAGLQFAVFECMNFTSGFVVTLKIRNADPDVTVK